MYLKTVALKCSKIKKGWKQYSITIPSDFINVHKEHLEAKDKIVLLAPEERSPFMVLIPSDEWFKNENTRDQIMKFLENFEWVL